MPENSARKRGRPRKIRVRIVALLEYLDGLPDDNSTKQRLTPDKMVVIGRYVQELEYLEGTLKRLKKDVAANGEVEVFEQGQQRLRRANPALEQYLSALRAYRGLVRQVSDLLRGMEMDIEREWL